MGSRLSAPSPLDKRFAAYVDGLAKAAGHEDRHAPIKDYCKGLLLPGERKSIEPMAARLNPGNVQSERQSLHHLVAKAPGVTRRCWITCASKCYQPCRSRAGGGLDRG